MKKGNRTTHGMFGTRTYTAWSRMKSRCLNPKATNYPKYGAKGIRVCERWLEFENFYEDMGKCPEGYSIDRLDPRGDYEKSNCRWATMFQQGSENKTDLRNITYKGRTQNLRAWERELGFKYSTVRARLNKGWSIKKALETPLVEYKGYVYDKVRKNYRVHVKWRGKQYFVGRYDTVEEALEARITFITKLRNEK